MRFSFQKMSEYQANGTAAIICRQEIKNLTETSAYYLLITKNSIIEGTPARDTVNQCPLRASVLVAFDFALS